MIKFLSNFLLIKYKNKLLALYIKKPARKQVFKLSVNYKIGTIRSATILIILISGFIAGPAVSL